MRLIVLALAPFAFTTGAFVFAGCLTEDGASQLDAATSERTETLIFDVTDEDAVNGTPACVPRARYSPGRPLCWPFGRCCDRKGTHSPFRPPVCRTVCWQRR